jgi:hypothetical protein
MSVQQATTGQGLKFSNVTAISGLKTFSFLIRLNAVSWNSVEANDTGAIWNTIPDAYVSGQDFGLNLFGRSAANKLRLVVGFTTTSGVWDWTPPSLNADHSILITYDGTATANNPVVYQDGISVSVTRTTAPVGTWAGLKDNVKLGNHFNSSGTNLIVTFKGKYWDARLYNVIKTAAQALVIAGENILTSATIDESGLVFHAPLTMCKGLTYPTFAGSVLGAGNTFFDRINGYLGVPSGSPVGQ